MPLLLNSSSRIFLFSLFWEASVSNYHEKKFPDEEEALQEAGEGEEDRDGVDLAKDGLSLILQRLKDIECKLDSLKGKESCGVVESAPAAGFPAPGPAPRRLSLPGRFTTLLVREGGVSPSTATPPASATPPAGEAEALSSSCCSTPTFLDYSRMGRGGAEDSDSTECGEEEGGEPSYKENISTSMNITSKIPCLISSAGT